MEGFVVSGKAAAAAKRKRATHPKQTIEQAVNEARHVGAISAAAKINKSLPLEDHVLPATIDTWLHRFRKEGKFWEKDTKRGRRGVLDSVPGVRDEMKRQTESFRSQGAAVTGRLTATIVKAALEEKAPSLLQRHGGSLKISVRSGQNFAEREGLSYRKRSSSRVIPPAEELADARDKFYSDLAACFPDQDVDRQLVINFDQTFHCYNPNRGFTWEKKGAPRVQLTHSKDGFTLLPVVHMSGVVGAQMIFDGSTSASLPTVTPGQYLHFRQTSNHWSNESTTIDLFKTVILPHIAARRAALGQPAAPAIVLADAFAAHWTPAVRALVAGEESIAYIAIPEGLTHLFQPLDLGIIAAIKNSVMRRKDEFCESELRAAIRENRGILLSKSRPLLRDRITMFIKECLQDPEICAEHCCKSGFDRAGISRVILGDHGTCPDVDEHVPPSSCAECGEFAVSRDKMPSCECFSEGSVVPLCDGCFSNHTELCPTVGNE